MEYQKPAVAKDPQGRADVHRDPLRLAGSDRPLPATVNEPSSSLREYVDGVVQRVSVVSQVSMAAVKGARPR
ncbi:hypothetical protein GCM10022220_08440 [Actinocatenispora rupis]|uniref:Uncharacterized protein n=1 Tax=Actinocatenispora rupis TaxID=519421 RepID=A0A8J3J864_9ACTN|nr:hypothetical protein Aru02nite_10470 [Actinocatenispora rupis]